MSKSKLRWRKINKYWYDVGLSENAMAYLSYKDFGNGNPRWRWFIVVNNETRAEGNARSYTNAMSYVEREWNRINSDSKLFCDICGAETKDRYFMYAKEVKCAKCRKIKEL